MGKYRKLKRLILRNIYWYLLKFKRTYKNSDCEGDYSTVTTAKMLFGDMYIMQVESYFKNKLIHNSKLEKEDIFPEPKNILNPFANFLKTTKDNDAIITPSGNVITTHPDDYLIATKPPQTLVGDGAPTINLSVIDKSTGIKVTKEMGDCTGGNV